MIGCVLKQLALPVSGCRWPPSPTGRQDQGGKGPVLHLENPSLIRPSLLLLVSSVACLRGGLAV